MYFKIMVPILWCLVLEPRSAEASVAVEEWNKQVGGSDVSGNEPTRKQKNCKVIEVP